jgi:adenylate cyclase
LVAVFIALGAAVFAYGLTTLQFFEGNVGQIEYATIDMRTRSVSRADAEKSQVRLVLFDSSYIASWPYLSPFPRAALATLIDAASAAGAKAIGLDVYLDRRYPALDRIDSGDVKLRKAIQRAGNVILVAPTVAIEGTNAVRELLPPDPYFADVAAGVATADLPTPFETIRDAVFSVRTQSGFVPSFSLALYAQATGFRFDSLAATRLPGMPAQYARLSKADATQTIPILFEGPPSRTDREDGAFKAISGLALRNLAIESPESLPFLGFKDKIVILGSGWHESERFRTPFYGARPTNDSTIIGDVGIYGWTYGPEIHANALQNLLDRQYLVPVSAAAKWLLLIAVALFVAAVTFWRSVKWGAISAFVGAAVVAVVAWIVFGRSNAIVPVVAPAFASLFAFLGSTSYVSIVEGRDKRMLRNAFGKYLSPEVVDALVADPSRLKLGGDRRRISILFSDLAGFTSMSERLDPQRLVTVLNQYLDEMSDLVMNEEGWVNKFIGDAVMALYNAPNDVPDHALRACRTALQMQAKLNELNERWRAQDPGWSSLSVRIGVSTGEPVIGNIGGEEKFEYTALGDSVNLAARLEPACKTYGVRIIIAQETRDAAGDAIRVRELDMLAVYGKSEPVRVYELLGLRGENSGEQSELIEHYNRGLSAFRDRDFELALQYFRAALDIDSEDGPSLMYCERCEEYMINPPPADWDFVERRQVK